MNAVDDQKLNRCCATSKAAELWASFDNNEKTACRFGMFPAAKMEKATAELIAAEVPARDASRMLAVALMDCASKDGGMRA